METITFIIVWALQLLIIQHGMETVRRFQDWAGPAVWVMMLILAIYLCVKAGGISFGDEIPRDVLIKKTADAGIPFEPGSFAALAAVAATWITYFAALYLNFCDFSRYAPDKRAVWTGNLWGLPINLVLFSFVAGITTTAAYAVYHEALLHPDEISARFDNWFLALVAALTFAVATLGINVVANFVSPAFDFANVFPSKIDFKRGGYIAALIALVLYPFAPWEGSAASFVGIIGSTMGPIFGIIMVDYYLIHNGEIDVPELYREEGIYRYTNGWNLNAVIAAAVGAVFSSILPNFTNILPSWWGVYGWFFGVAIGGAVYYALVKARGAPSLARPARRSKDSQPALLGAAPRRTDKSAAGGRESVPARFSRVRLGLACQLPPSGRERMRLPLAAKIAFMSAGATGGTPGSPTPPIGMS